MMASLHRSFQRGRTVISVIEQIDSDTNKHRITFHEYMMTSDGRLLMTDIRDFDLLEQATAHYDNERLKMDKELHALD